MTRNFLISFFFLLAAVMASAQDVSLQTEKKKKIEEEIKFIDNQLKEVLSQKSASMQQLSVIQKKILSRKNLISQSDWEIRQYRKQINDKNTEITRLRKELDTLEQHYSDMVYSTYKNRDNKLWFMYILASDNIGQGYRRFSYLKNLSQTASEQAKKITAEKEKLNNQLSELQELLKKEQELKAAREKEQKQLQSEETKSKSIVKSLSASSSKYQKELTQKRKEIEKLNKEIEKILAKTVSEQKKSKESVDYTLAGHFEQNKGKLPWPVSGIITESYGQQVHPVYKNIKMPANNGITITTTKNAEVKTVFDGVVKQILMMPGYNICVLVQHGNYFTFYCKLASVSVKAGQTVSTGEVLGKLEADGKASTLHFQVWKETTKQNPEAWLK
ncbi:MAG: peptidoglycan DD-metalloendopeptidase family protein [Bacteroidales bacterium]|nr:peptidoglycan DD-metalloendopeptidase family protein [Bacteroidales bacterium]